MCEIFSNIKGGTVEDLTSSKQYQNRRWGYSRSLSTFEAPPNDFGSFGDNYGIRVTGFIKPPKTGEYVFYLTSDDEGELYISSDESPDNLELVASVKRGPSGIGNESGRTDKRAWGANPSAVSKSIQLEAGKRYAIHAVMKEDSGQDHLSVTWQMPGEEPPKPGDEPIPGAYLEFEVDKTLIADEKSTPFVRRGREYISTQQWDLARTEWRQAVELQPYLVEDAFVAFRDAKQWGTAAEFAQEVLEQRSPSPAWRWLKYVPVFVRADDSEAYRKFTRTMTQAFPASSASLGDTDCTLKASLIWPGKLDISKPHADRLAELLDNEEQPRLPTSWALGTRALLALRTGDAEAAVEYVAESEQLGPIDLARPFMKAVLAMANMELNKTEEAIAALAKARELITDLKQDPIKKDNHDTLIAEILIREAEAKINGKNDPADGA